MVGPTSRSAATTFSLPRHVWRLPWTLEDLEGRIGRAAKVRLTLRMPLGSMAANSVLLKEIRRAFRCDLGKAKHLLTTRRDRRRHLESLDPALKHHDHRAASFSTDGTEDQVLLESQNIEIPVFHGIGPIIHTRSRP